MRIAIWSPLPPSPSGIADYVAEQLPGLSRRADVEVVVEDPGSVEVSSVRLRSPTEEIAADLDVYHLGNSPAHAYVYRAALKRPGVAFLHDWSLHHLVLKETVERGDRTAYLREMRRAHGERGTFVGRQVARGLGGDILPALFPLNDRVLEGSLAVVGLTEYVRARTARRLPGRALLHLPHHFSLPLDPLPSRQEARRHLGLPEGALLVTAPGLATVSKRLEAVVRVLPRLRKAFPNLLLVVAGEGDGRLPLKAWAEEGVLVTGRTSLADFARHLVASDVVLALRFPTHGEISGALVRALGIGRPALVTAGTPGCEEFPEGVVVPVDPGPYESEELFALLSRLLEDEGLRLTISGLARRHIQEAHGLEGTLDRLMEFLEGVFETKAATLSSLAQDQAPEGSLLGYLMEEVRWGARDLGLPGLALGLEGLLSELVGGGS
jgi:glycosyltransferase involved in cell wall biosynthesis